MKKQFRLQCLVPLPFKDLISTFPDSYLTQHQPYDCVQWSVKRRNPNSLSANLGPECHPTLLVNPVRYIVECSRISEWDQAWNWTTLKRSIARDLMKRAKGLLLAGMCVGFDSLLKSSGEHPFPKKYGSVILAQILIYIYLLQINIWAASLCFRRNNFLHFRSINRKEYFVAFRSPIYTNPLTWLFKIDRRFNEH